MTQKEIEELRDKTPVGRKVWVRKLTREERMQPEYEKAKILKKYPHFFTAVIRGKIRCVRWSELMVAGGDGKLA